MIRRLLPFSFNHRLKWCHRARYTSCRFTKRLHRQWRAAVGRHLIVHNTPASDTLVLSTVPFFHWPAYWSITILSHVSLRFFCCIPSSARPRQFGCASRAAMFWCRSRVQSLVFFFRFFLLLFLHHDVTFHQRVQFPVLGSPFVIAFVPRCGTDWGQSRVRQ